jgi:signal transduction histidine kinase
MLTGIFYLDWAALALSLFNTILLVWLGLTVLLNAERRGWGIWLTGGGLLVAGAFFLSHSAILGHSQGDLEPGLNIWWHAGWVPAILSPLAWYIEMLWYGGFWDDRSAPIHRRQFPGLIFIVLLAFGSLGLVFFANPFPSFTRVANLDLASTPAIGGIPLLILVYLVYIILCTGLSMDALRFPGPSARLMGELARRRARPWFMAASLVLLVVSLLVAWVMLWIVMNAAAEREFTFLVSTIGWFDVSIASLIALAVVLLGQAIVAYEVFTGKSLPRRGLARYWRRAVILAGGYSLVVGWGLTLQLRPIYSLLMTTLVMTVFYALLSWRSYAERERFIEYLRPFVTSQRLYENLLTKPVPTSLIHPGEVEIDPPFRALCRDVLGTRQAYLAAQGPLAPLYGPPLKYPENAEDNLPGLSELVVQFRDPQIMGVPVSPDEYGGAIWAIPLWSERGLIGVLLLGEKSDGGLYTQEEIEIARATSERLIDTRAGAEMARRLMAIQRQSLAQNQVLDRRSRRILHDEILPRLHAIILSLGSSQVQNEPVVSDALTSLGEVHREISNLLRAMPVTGSPQIARLGMVDALRQVVDDELSGAFDQVSWNVDPESEELLQSISPLVVEVVYTAAREVIRNAAHHARSEAEDQALNLRIAIHGRETLNILVEDNGVGLNQSGTAVPGGRNGQGLSLHSTMMAVVGGSMVIESEPGFTRAVLSLPLESWLDL